MIYLGLDIGEANDPTALTALEKRLNPKGEKIYPVRHVERFPLNETYPAMIDRFQSRINALNLEDRYMAIVDATGVGRPVVDLLRKNKIRCTPVVITGGQNENFDPEFGAWNVPKMILISTVQVLMQNNQLQFARSMPNIDLLIEELLNFKMKTTAAKNVTYEAWRDGDHDDMVLSLAIAAWYAQKFGITEEERRQPVSESPLLRVKGI